VVNASVKCRSPAPAMAQTGKCWQLEKDRCQCVISVRQRIPARRRKLHSLSRSHDHRGRAGRSRYHDLEVDPHEHGALALYRRIFSAYLGSGRSQLTFWHETPEANPRATSSQLGEYYMLFREKADYAGHYDGAGIPMLDYHGTIGLQYNPIAIAHGVSRITTCSARQATQTVGKNVLGCRLLAATRNRTLTVSGLEPPFRLDYRDTLKSPCIRSRAGQGVSLLLRAYAHGLTRDISAPPNRRLSR